MGRFQILEILSSVKLQAFLCEKAFSGDQQPGRVTEAAVQIQGLSSLNFPNRIHQEALVGSLGSRYNARSQHRPDRGIRSAHHAHPLSAPTASLAHWEYTADPGLTPVLKSSCSRGNHQGIPLTSPQALPAFKGLPQVPQEGLPPSSHP